MNKILKDKPIKRVSIVDSVLKRITDLIQKGDLKPGEKLPTIKAFSEKMQVGASSVREALKQLQIMGIIVIKQGEGTFINDKVSINHISDRLGYLLDIKKPDISYCVEARKIIERGTVALAAERASEKEINNLNESIQRMKKVIDNPKEFALENINFHLNIAKASKNPLLLIIFDTIHDLFIEEQKGVAEALDLKSQSIESHGSIYNAIKNHDVGKAIKEMEKHLNNIIKAILSS